MRPIILIASLMLALLVGCKRHEAPVPEDPGTTAVKSALYQAPAQPLVAGGSCALDSVDGAPAANASVKAGAGSLFAGWMGDAQKQVPEKAMLIFKGQAQSYQYPLRAKGERQDVVAALGAPGLAMSGYNVVLSLKGIAPGKYFLSIINNEEPATECNLNIELTVIN
ncbi:hypothetical protein KWH29_05055 [Xanthomonas campestris pv. paulliniae]|uniref:hypothetical protein n=1 Tax=Xanthomonas euvesicatoria TaxID=456327 RepID=UPI001C478286|nr:hypothetical protein [Xanthomonas euvesicatoria]MBV6844713.1 hypothetical protein [Xanthomonas campestris pv. paulliniae]